MVNAQADARRLSQRGIRSPCAGCNRGKAERLSRSSAPATINPHYGGAPSGTQLQRPPEPDPERRVNPGDHHHEEHMQTIEQRINKIVAYHLAVKESDIKPDSNLEDDLGADSLDLIEILMVMEDEFDVEISDEDGGKVKTVQQAVDLITKHPHVNVS